MKRILGVSAVVLTGIVLSGCTDRSKQVAHDGHYFRAKANKVEKQRDVFVVTVRDVSRSIDGARQAAYHTGISYCLASFGSSDIIWEQDPLDKETSLRIADDTLTVQGRCPQALKV